MQVESLYQEPAVHAQRIHRMIKLGLGIDEADEEASYPIDYRVNFAFLNVGM